tara:strand:+ start:1260 stop:3245 length:1986 start_codon:yes stop_codon:yes gene_type:complete
MDNHFKIIIPLYNVEKWVKFCIRSVKKQSYTNFECIIIDDLSTDKSNKIINKEIEKDGRFKLITNTEKAYALKNIYNGIDFSDPKDEDIIITLDGDDWLANRDVLRALNRRYNETACWLTYGSYIEYPAGTKGKFAKKIPLHITKNNLYRQHEWCTSHLRSFKYHLWKKIKKQDLLDNEGNFYRMAWDLSFMFPMLEMSGEKSQYIEDILYVYNIDNPLNDHKIDNFLQLETEGIIRKKNKYSTLEPETIAAYLLNSKRFDIAAKLIYAKSYLKDAPDDFAKELYLQHLKVWNNFYEKSPEKRGSESFLRSFNDLLSSIKNKGFHDSGRIPVINNSAINGAHRIAACIALNKNLKTYKADPSEGQYFCNYEYFKEKKDFVITGLEEIYLDEMALEFCRNKNNLYTISLFPSHDYPVEKLVSIVEQEYGIIYKKTIKLNEVGKLNYIHNLYYEENWIGLKDNGFPGVHEKAKFCFSRGNDIVVLLLEGDTEKMISLKKNLREICNAGKHSVHINDTQRETWRIASSVFNKNSIHLMNNKEFKKTLKFDRYFDRYRQIIDYRSDKEDFCIDSSAVLSAYGLRDCRDLDFLHLHDIPDLYEMIECHNKESHHYCIPKDEIIYNPKNHFYMHGVKFASLDVIRGMKESRSEEKDRIDLQYIGKIL